MAEEIIRNVTKVAAEDLNAKQFYIMGLDSSGNMVAADGDHIAGSELGPLQDKPKNTEAGSVCIIGLSKVIYGDTVTVGQKLKADATARAVPATTDKDFYVGTAQIAGAVGEEGEMLCERGYVSK